KRQGVLRRHWLAHRQSECPRCHIPFEKRKLGRTARIAYYCERCQELFGPT
ncbi:endonuclease, partial [Paracidovorax avenae]